MEPKLNPDIESEPPPDSGPLEKDPIPVGKNIVTTDESKVNKPWDVPTSSPLIVAARRTVWPTPAVGLHIIRVTLTQEAVEQSAVPSRSVSVGSEAPKL